MTSEPRLTLRILSYPSEDSIEIACDLIYAARDKTLMASLSSLPYTVGRGFSTEDSNRLAAQLSEAKIGFEFVDPLSKKIIHSHGRPAEVPGANEQVPTTPQLKWILFLVAGILTAVILALVPYKDVYRKVTGTAETTSTEDPASNHRALISNVKNQVDFRRSKDLLWSQAQVNEKLFDKDAVRTGSESVAVLQYREGSSLIVRPNSLVVIDQGKDESSRKVDLSDGSIQARLKNTNPPTSLAIETKSGTIQLSGKVGEPVEARVETSLKGTELKVAVAQGRARLLPKTPDAKPIDLATRQQIQVTPEQVGEVREYTPRLTLYFPSPDVILSVDPEQMAPLKFEWEDLGASVVYRWTMASDEAFQNILFSQETSEPKVEINYADPGKIYWRVEADEMGMKISSEVSSFYVKKPND